MSKSLQEKLNRALDLKLVSNGGREAEILFREILAELAMDLATTPTTAFLKRATSFRLAHLLFRRAENIADFNEILLLLEDTATISPHVRLLQAIAHYRILQNHPAGNLEQRKLQIESLLKEAYSSRRSQISMRETDHQQDLMENFIEIFIFSTGLSYQFLEGLTDPFVDWVNKECWYVVSTGKRRDEVEIGLPLKQADQVFEEWRLELQPDLSIKIPASSSRTSPDALIKNGKAVASTKPSALRIIGALCLVGEIRRIDLEDELGFGKERLDSGRRFFTALNEARTWLRTTLDVENPIVEGKNPQGATLALAPQLNLLVLTPQTRFRSR